MPRTYRVSPQRRYSFLLLVGLILFLPFVDTSPAIRISTLGTYFIFGLICTCMIYIALDEFVTRVVATDEGIVAYDLINRKRFTVNYDDFTAYRPTPIGTWALFVGEKRLMLPRIEFSEFHALMAARAPRSLNAKPWHCGQVPPSQEFEGLLVFDAETWFISVLGIGVMAGILSFLGPAFVVGYVSYPAFSRIYALKDLFGRLSLKTEGLEVHWLVKRKKIAWEEISAVFCERRGRSRRFVVTSGSTSIIVPRHVAIEIEAMRKFFYSLPEGTPCVNFGPDINRGYRVRRRKEQSVLDLGGLDRVSSPM